MHIDFRAFVHVYVGAKNLQTNLYTIFDQQSLKIGLIFWRKTWASFQVKLYSSKA